MSQSVILPGVYGSCGFAHQALVFFCSAPYSSICSYSLLCVVFLTPTFVFEVRFIHKCASCATRQAEHFSSHDRYLLQQGHSSSRTKVVRLRKNRMGIPFCPCLHSVTNTEHLLYCFTLHFDHSWLGTALLFAVSCMKIARAGCFFLVFNFVFIRRHAYLTDCFDKFE